METKFQRILPFLILICSNFSLFGQEKPTKISFLQGNDTILIENKSETIFLERNPFSIRFFTRKYQSEKMYSMQVAVLADPKDTLILSKEKNTENIPFFLSGSGMAPGYNNMYDTIFITNNGSHYLIYDGDENNRAYLIAENNNELELEWKIMAANYKNKVFKFKKLRLNELYFIFF